MMLAALAKAHCARNSSAQFHRVRFAHPRKKFRQYSNSCAAVASEVACIKNV
jgi:hypothetical protein